MDLIRIRSVSLTDPICVFRSYPDPLKLCVCELPGYIFPLLINCIAVRDPHPEV